jgi:competence ComEA-like helix-hairpin-helix protein
MNRTTHGRTTTHCSTNRSTYRRRSIALALVTLLAMIAGPSLAAGERGTLTGTVNVNTATVDELQLLPGIGESRAKAVVAMRKQRGGFKSIAELTDVKGIGDAALAKLRPFARIEGKTTAQQP